MNINKSIEILKKHGVEFRVFGKSIEVLEVFFDHRENKTKKEWVEIKSNEKLKQILGY